MDLRACDFFTGGCKYVSIWQDPVNENVSIFRPLEPSLLRCLNGANNEKAEEEKSRVRSANTVT